MLTRQVRFSQLEGATLPSPRELLNAAKAEIREIDPHEVAERLHHYYLLDVREPDEFEQGAVPGAIHVPRGNLEFSVEGRLPDKSVPVAVYCAGGVRSAFAAKTLQELGYTDVVSVIGGFNKWKDEGLVWTTPHTMTSDQRIRYHRHLLLPEVGEAGQMKLLDAKVLLLGAGGLGSPAALYLAAAGVGTIGIIDMDVVDASNLQRQILHNLDRVGMRKVDSARMTLEAINPDLKVKTYDTRLGADNVLDIIDGYDVIVDGRQLPDALLGQRRGPAQAHSRRARVHLSLRRTDHRLQPLRRAVLSLHDPRAAARGVGAELCRSGCTGCAAGHRRLHPGGRDDQAAARAG